MDSQEMAKALIEELQNRGAHYEAMRAYDDDNALAAAVFVVQGQTQTTVILEAFEEVVGEWEDA